MRLPVLFATAILSPIAILAALLLPAYASIFGAAYIVYAPASGPHPMAEKYLEVGTIIDTYGALFDYWTTNRASLDFVEYTLPIIGLPLLGCIFALWLTYTVIRRLINFFQLSASI